MMQMLLPFPDVGRLIPTENRGVVYTKPWVVNLLLDLAGYTSNSNLVDCLAVEPAAGQGAFLAAMACRLARSCQRQGRPLSDCADSLVAYEIDEQSAAAARHAIVVALKLSSSIPTSTAEKLSSGWIRTADYLLEALYAPKADFVIGNPPYIRLEDIPEWTAGYYRDSFKSMRGRADIYVAFFEAALRQLKPDGTTAFICADRWMLNQYGSELRKFITSGFDVQTVLEMHNADAFDTDVSAYPAITVIRRRPQGRVVVASAEAPKGPIDTQELALSLKPLSNSSALKPIHPVVSSSVVENWFRGDEPWPCSSPARLRILRRLEEAFPVLEDGEHTRVGIGVATGCDAVFITKDAGLVETSRLLPLAMAKDTMTGRLKQSGHYLVDPWSADGLVELDDFPRLKAYFERHKAALSKRHTVKNNVAGWYKTIDRVTHSLKKIQKLYIPDIKDQFNPVLDRGETYPHHNLYFISSDRWDLEVLGGILLSSVAQFFIEAYGVRMRGGYFRFQAQYLRRVRVPNPANIKRTQSEKLIKAFRTRDRELATDIALELYGLTHREMEGAREP